MLAVAMMLYAVIVFGYLVSQAVAFIQAGAPAPAITPTQAAEQPASANQPDPAEVRIVPSTGSDA